jgi:hypothetical protein
VDGSKRPRGIWQSAPATPSCRAYPHDGVSDGVSDGVNCYGKLSKYSRADWYTATRVETKSVLEKFSRASRSEA